MEQREIKFRAYDKKWDRMYESEYIDYSHGEWELQRMFENGDEAECVSIDNKEVFLLEYTGQVDKHGEEIYEDHIIEGELGDFEHDILQVQWMEDRDFCGWNIEPGWESRCEIIGNIHQNPELIN